MSKFEDVDRIVNFNYMVGFINVYFDFFIIYYEIPVMNRLGLLFRNKSFLILELQVPPIEIKVTPKSLRITEGSTALFLCSVNTVATTHTRSWSREGYRLLPSNAKVLDGTLSFRNAKKEDSGVYTCSASNQVSVDSATIVLSVGGKTLVFKVRLWNTGCFMTLVK